MVSQSVEYMSKRAPRQVTITMHDTTGGKGTALASTHLLEWVLENLLKNALDAMDGQGDIVVSLEEIHAQICIDVHDTGKGIPAIN